MNELMNESLCRYLCFYYVTNFIFVTSLYMYSQHSKGSYPKKKIISFKRSTGELVWNPAPGEPSSAMGGLFKNSAIDVRKITGVQLGTASKVLQVAKGVDPLSCVCISAQDRSLDLTLPSTQERGAFIRALMAILEDYGIHIPVL